jgi:hypothetical protein
MEQIPPHIPGGRVLAEKQTKPEEIKITPEMLEANNYPKAALYLAAFGGLLLLVQGLVCIFLKSLYFAITIDVISGLGSVVIGILLVIDGLIVGGAAVSLLLKPELRQAAGATVIIFALLGLLFGGGWYIGSILAFIGGILALTWKPEKGKS